MESSQASASQMPYIVVDADNGTILDANKPDHRWYPASLTKLMTAYVTFRAIASGAISPGSPVVISAAARKQPPSKMGYKQGVKLRVDTALEIIIIKSANDVSHALGEAVSGTLAAFVDDMNKEAKRLKMRNTRFANANGLHDKSQFTSARDMGILARQLIKEFPQYAYMFKAVGIKTPAKTHYSYNLLLERLPGTTGMKTGFVCASGYNMIASAKLGARNLVAVVFGASSQTDRAVSAAKLLTRNKDASGGKPLFSDVQRGDPPRNMRPVLCTEKARANRYDPVAGTAIIKSPFLSARKVSNRIIPIATGRIDAPPGDAWLARALSFNGNPPVPSKRPNFDPATGQIILAAIGKKSTGRLAIPTPRPQQ